VDDYLNKRDIGAKPPSTYMESIAKRNAKIAETMQTHLIDDLELFGVWNDDYSTFIGKRGERVLSELQSGLNPAEVARHGSKLLGINRARRIAWVVVAGAARDVFSGHRAWPHHRSPLFTLHARSLGA
jgi:hypothetical protein